MIIFALRHGECDRESTTGKYLDDKVRLNKNGRLQMIQCGEWFLRGSIPVESTLVICASPVPRVIESAEILLRILKPRHPLIELRLDDRLSNKQIDNAAFEASLLSLVEECKFSLDWVVFVAHGRILKMFSSLCRHGNIDIQFTASLSDYPHGEVFLFLW